MTIASSSRVSRTLALITVAAAGFALSGCTLINQFTGANTATRDESGDVIEGNDNTDVFSLQVGDCLNDAEVGETVETLATVPCAEPHDSEIYASMMIDGDAFPGDDAIAVEAEAACLAAFADFVGVEWVDSKYFYSYYLPTEGSWSGGDREVLCTIYDEAGQTTGSLQNIGL